MMLKQALPALSVLILWCCPHAAGQVWTEGFEDGPGDARSYHREAPQTTLELAADNPAEGERYLRAVLPGERGLEGVNVTATGLSGGRLATATAQVRGRGELWLCLYSRNGWLYSPGTVTLTDRWQTVSLSKALVQADTTLSIHFMSRERQQDAVFEVDDIRVYLADPPRVYDAAVGPWSLEAEDYAVRRAYIAADAEASGGRVARDGRYIALRNLPFPRTSRPVTVWLRVKPGTDGEEYRLNTYQGGNRQILVTVKPERADHWEWLRFAPVTAGEAGDSFGVDLGRARGAVGVTAFDRLVISTEADLDEAALDAAPALYPRRPLAQVARCLNPPQIDGNPDDPCWEHAVALTDFLGVRSLTPAAAPTTVRMCYDDEHLYVLFTCEEPILDVAMQRRHEFRATVEERDGDVYRDDSALLLLDPTNTGAQAFDFTVNALGTVADAHCPGPNLWETRDVTWNSAARAAGSIGDGVFTVEMAIPFADLTDAAPAEGDVWQAVAGRIARERRETTSWNRSNRGFHDPHEMGALVFGGPQAGVALSTPGALEPGRNPLTAALHPRPDSPAAVYLAASIAGPTGMAHSYLFTEAAEPTTVAHEVDVREEADLDVAYAVLDAASLRPLYLSPTVTRAVRSTTATVALSSDGPYELFLNGELLQRGPQAEAVELSAPLQRGANVFALRLEEGTAAARIMPPGLPVEPGAWKMAPADTPDATLARLDDSGWATAPHVAEGGEIGPVVGAPGEAVVLRQTLLWEKTRQWPTPLPALYVARNSNQHLTFICDGLPGRRLLDWTVYLAVPLEFDILGATGYYGNVDYMPHFPCEQLGEQEVAGRTMRVARITATKPVLTGRHYIMSLFNALVRYREEAGEPQGEETQFIYWAEANDRTIVEAPQVIPVRLLGPLNGRQPQTLMWQLWGSFFGNINDLQMREATLETAQRAGVTDIVAGDRWTSDNAPRFGMTNTKGINFQSWSLNMAPYLEERPEARLVDAEGEFNGGLLCMTLLLDDEWAAVEAALANRLEDGARTLDYDYEYGPFAGPHSCYCPRCLEAFREYADLPADTPLDGRIIRDEHDEAWVDFMARRVAQMMRKFRDTIHRLAPGVKFSVYSGYQTPENPRQYGINWAYIGELQACDHAGCGYGRPVQAISATVEALQGIPVVFGALMQPYNTQVTTPQIPFTKARLLRRSLDATGGVLLYDRLPMDGRTWLAIAETTRLVAEHEEAFLHGGRTALGDLPPAEVQILTHGDVTLVCVMNHGGSEAQWTLPLPAAAGRGAEFYTGETVAAGATVTCILPPGEAAVYVLGR